MKSSLKFLNHASYLCEYDDFILLCDPWLEGAAFNNGWRLLDESTSNDKLISYLVEKNKPLFVWYSHEHSDHFAVPFLKKLKKVNLAVHFVYQTTNDQRVVNYLKRTGFQVTVLKDGEKFRLGEDSWLSICAWKSGDSYLLARLEDTAILNLNDCIVRSSHDVENINAFVTRSGVEKIDVLFTQFGYASWSGNEADVEIRKKEADEKLNRIATQIEILNPDNVILFASFVYFSNEENYYLNDQQNTPDIIRKNVNLDKYQDRIFFLKPFDDCPLDLYKKSNLRLLSLDAEKHWQHLIDSSEPADFSDNSVSIDAINNSFKQFRKSIFINFLWIFSLLELIGFIDSLRVKLIDKNKVLTLSYRKKLIVDNDLDDWDVSMTSAVLLYSLKHEFGFDSTHVNGRFRSNTQSTAEKFLYFFGPQNMLKTGFGMKRPISTFKEFWRLARR